MKRFNVVAWPRLLRALAWAGIILIAYLSLRPGGLGARTGLPGYLEHALAFAVVGGLSALAYPTSRRALILAFLLYAAVLETGQILLPGRDAKYIEGAGSAIGACLGILATRAWAKQWLRSTAGPVADRSDP